MNFFKGYYYSLHILMYQTTTSLFSLSLFYSCENLLQGFCILLFVRLNPLQPSTLFHKATAKVIQCICLNKLFCHFVPKKMKEFETFKW